MKRPVASETPATLHELLKRLCEVQPEFFSMLSPVLAASTYMPNSMRLEIQGPKLVGWELAGWMLHHLWTYDSTASLDCWGDRGYSFRGEKVEGQGATPIEAIVRAYVAWKEATKAPDG